MNSFIARLFLFGGATAVFGVSFAVYYITVSPYIQPGDSAEMVTAALIPAVPHQPGYPLNTLLGFAASRLEIGFIDEIKRINLVSSLLSSTALVFIYFASHNFISLIAKKKQTILAILASFTGSLYVGFSLVHWQYATKFEVFPLNNFFISVSLLLSSLLVKRRKEDSECVFFHRGNFSISILLTATLSLALTHHQTVVLIAPFFIVLFYKDIISIFSIFRKEAFKIAALIAVFAISLSMYFVSIIKIATSSDSMHSPGIRNVKDAYLSLIRSDFGTFSPFLKTEQEYYINNIFPLDQIIFYTGRIIAEFSVIGAILAVIGLVYLYKHERVYFAAFFSAFILSGYIFLSYANFPISTSFDVATIERFFMLPNIFVGIFIIFGLYWISEYIFDLVSHRSGYKLGVYFAQIYLTLSFIYLIYLNFGRADNSYNDLTHKYIQDVYANLERPAMILVSGDIPNMTSEYYMDVRSVDEVFIAFSPGRFYLDWFFKGLILRNENIVIPPPLAGRRFTTATQVIAENIDNYNIYVSPELLDRDIELSSAFVLYPRHLVLEARTIGEDISIEKWDEENDRIYSNLDIDKIARIRRKSPTFEDLIIFYYARHFSNVGFVYHEVGLYEKAIINFMRSLSIDPGVKENYLGLSQSYASDEISDYPAAINYLNTYIELIGTGNVDAYYQAQDLLNSYYEKYFEMIEKSQEYDPADFEEEPLDLGESKFDE